MRLLLDSHAFLWWSLGHRRIGAKAKAALKAARNEVFVSVASLWELSIKHAIGKLDLPDELPAMPGETGFAALPIQIGHAIEAGRLPRHHDDPFDRMLVAQAQLEQLTLVTHDRRFEPYGVRTMWI